VHTSARQHALTVTSYPDFTGNPVRISRWTRDRAPPDTMTACLRRSSP